jgi:hypothetical protein
MNSNNTGEPDAWRHACPVRGGLGENWQLHSVAILLHKNNPQAASSVVMGLVFVLLASSVASLISFT